MVLIVIIFSSQSLQSLLPNDIVFSHSLTGVQVNCIWNCLEKLIQQAIIVYRRGKHCFQQKQERFMRLTHSSSSCENCNSMPNFFMVSVTATSFILLRQPAKSYPRYERPIGKPEINDRRKHVLLSGHNKHTMILWSKEWKIVFELKKRCTALLSILNLRSHPTILLFSWRYSIIFGERTDHRY